MIVYPLEHSSSCSTLASGMAWYECSKMFFSITDIAAQYPEVDFEAPTSFDYERSRLTNIQKLLIQISVTYYFVTKICILCLKRLEINGKEAGIWPYIKIAP